MRSARKRLLLFIIISMMAIWNISALAANKAKLQDNVALPDCRGCHETQVVPDKHPDLKDKNNQDCGQCHEPGKETTLRGKMPLGHLHLAAGVSCGDCHGGQQPFKAVPTEQCRECHGNPDKMEALTKDRPVNPHTSPHYGNEMDCDMCHHLHRASENVCNECHDNTCQTP